MADQDEPAGVISTDPASLEVWTAEVGAGPDDGKRVLVFGIHRQGNQPFCWFVTPDVAAVVGESVTKFLEQEAKRNQEIEPYLNGDDGK